MKMSQESSSSGSDLAEQVAMIATLADNIEQMQAGGHWEQLVRLVGQRIIISRLQCEADVQAVLTRMVNVVQDTLQQNEERVRLLHELAVNSQFFNNVEMMARTACIPTNPHDNFDGARFYVRSQQLTRDQLAATLQIYQDQFADTELCDHFHERFLNGTGQPRNVFIRYVGCTIATTPQSRMLTDLGSDDPNRLNNFMRAMAQANIEPNLLVYEFPRLEINAGPNGEIDHDLIDITEQILIHLFDRDVLLNSQPG